MAYLYQVVSIKNDKHEKKSFSNNPLSKVRYDVSRSCLSTLVISYLWTINQPSIVQMTSNLAQGCAVTWQMMFETMPCQFRLNFLENSCKNSNLIKGSIISFVNRNIDRPYQNRLLASYVKHMMVWCYITLWPQNTFWTPPKSFIHYSQTLDKP